MDTILSSYLRQVTPAIDLHNWQPSCPICSSAPIQVDPESYLLFVQRHWCYGSCTSCHKQFLLDLPTPLYPLCYSAIMDLDTGNCFGSVPWSWWEIEMSKMYFGLLGGQPVQLQKPQKPRALNEVVKSIIKLSESIAELDYQRLYNATEKILNSRKKHCDYSDRTQPSLEIEYKTPSNSKPILLFNCLDEYYGHSVRFIQFVYNTYNEIGQLLKDENIAIAVLIPEALKFYVPDFVDQVWIVKHLPGLINRKTFRDQKFSDMLNSELRKRVVYVLKKLPDIGVGVDARQYFHMDTVQRKATLEIQEGSPVLVFYHREDYRSWGGHPKLEIDNYSRLANQIKKKYPDSVIYLVGHKYTYPVQNKNIVDLRKDGFSQDYWEKQINYLYLLSMADCAVGVHGSHIMEMSALSKTLVTLQPDFKYANYSDDMLLIKSDHFVADFQRYYSIFGNKHLNDVTPKKVHAIIEAALHRYKKHFHNYSN